MTTHFVSFVGARRRLELPGGSPLGQGYFARARLPTDPLGTFVLTLVGLSPGSDIVILGAGTATERINIDANAGSTYNYTFSYFSSGSDFVDIGIFKVGYVPFYVRGYELQASNATLPIAQTPDRAYLNP